MWSLSQWDFLMSDRDGLSRASVPWRPCFSPVRHASAWEWPFLRAHLSWPDNVIGVHFVWVWVGEINVRKYFLCSSKYGYVGEMQCCGGERRYSSVGP